MATLMNARIFGLRSLGSNAVASPLCSGASLEVGGHFKRDDASRQPQIETCG